MLGPTRSLPERLMAVLAVVDICGLVVLTGSAIALWVLTALVRPVHLPTYLPYHEFAVVDDLTAVQYRLALGPSVYPGHALGVICFIGAIQHLLSLLFGKHQWDGITRGFNWMIWPEFALTMALSIMVLSWILGTLSFFEFMTYSVCPLLACIIAFLVEADSYFSGARKVNTVQMVVNVWGPSVVAMVLTLMPWIPFFVQFAFDVDRSISTVPWWVIVSTFITFALFQIIGIMFILQRIVLSDDKWPCGKRPGIFRVGYAIFGIVFKVVIAWVIAGGILQRDVFQ